MHATSYFAGTLIMLIGMDVLMAMIYLVVRESLHIPQNSVPVAHLVVQGATTHTDENVSVL